jgi:hypothetical protein
VVVQSSSSEKVFESDRSFKKKKSGLSRFSSFFRTRSDDYDSRRDSCDASTVFFSTVVGDDFTVMVFEGYISSIEETINHQYLLHRRFDRFRIRSSSS